MHQPYRDILRKLGRPLWWDEEGVPRYEPFAPDLSANIYADFVALLEIRCQGCKRIFPVASNWGYSRIMAMDSRWEQHIVWDESGKNPQPREGLPKTGDAACFGYGDAPWHDYDGGFEGQCSGTTMTTDTVRILECWARDYSAHRDWKRLTEHEVYVGEDAP